MTAVPPDVQAVADALLQARASTVEVARRLSESQMYRGTGRPGWTLKHELACAIAHDRELLHAVGEVARRPPPIVLDLRRLRAEAMHRSQQLRLRPLIEEIEHAGAAVVAALFEHQPALDRALELAHSEPASLGALAHAQVSRLHAAAETVRQHVAQ